MATESGTQDKTYDLVSVLYHALEGATLYGRYAEDAERAGDSELASSFFKEVKEEERKRADRAKRFLGKRLSS